MAYDNNNPDPLYIDTGDLLTPLSMSGTRYSFEHITFAGVPIISYPDDFNPESAREEDALKFFPKNADSMLCFQRIGSLADSFEESGYAESIDLDKKEIDKKDSGFITPAGTLVPQILYPWNFGRNDLVLDSAVYKNGQRAAAERTKSYLWAASEQKLPKNSSEELKKAVKVLKHYGAKYTVSEKGAASYLSILGKHPLMDKNKFERTYTCNFPAAGTFALLLDFTTWENDESGKNPAGVTFKFYQDDSSSASSSNSAEYDCVEVKAAPGGEVTVTINEKNSVAGPLTFTQLGTKILHTNSTALNSKNVLFFYSLMNSLVVTGDLVTNPAQSSKNLICRKKQDLNILNETEPPLNRFPASHKMGSADVVKLTSKQVYVNFGNRVQAVWKNCTGNFAFAALRYCPVVSFSYFFKLSGEQTSTNDGLSGVEDYYCLEIGGKNAGYQGLDSLYRSRKIYYDAETQTSVFRVDFKIYIRKGKDHLPLQLYPFEIFGLIHVTKRTGALTAVLNNDGDFSKGFNDNVDPSRYSKYTGGNTQTAGGKEWTDFILSANISHGLDGTTGSLTVDKYMMMDSLSRSPRQAIGALTLIARNGFYKSDGTTANGEPYSHISHSSYPALPWGQIFRGYAMEIQDNVTEGSSQLTIKLAGLQKKLSDMKLVNCPFWDGDQVFENGKYGVLNYLISYSGCDLRYVPEFSSGAGPVSGIILPRSWDWQAPSTNFVLGTPVLDALREIARKINHQFVIQPDGRGYFYYMDEYGAPTWLKSGPVVMTYKESDIISMDVSPYLENRYNTFLTLGVLVKNDTQTKSLVPDGVKPGMQFSQTGIREDDYPWSRIITRSEPGVVTIKELEKFHKVNIRFGSSSIFTGTVTVPGYHGFYLFDKIQINCDNGQKLRFYITGISHNINLQLKEWTTSLSIAAFEKGEDS